MFKKTKIEFLYNGSTAEYTSNRESCLESQNMIICKKSDFSKIVEKHGGSVRIYATSPTKFILNFKEKDFLQQL